MLKFFHEERGGSEAPIRRMARWGLHVKIHTTSQFILSNFKSSWMLPITFFTAVCASDTYVNTLRRAKNFKRFKQKEIANDFYIIITWYKRSLELFRFWAVKKWVVWTQRLSSNDWSCRRETFHAGRKNHMGLRFAALIPSFNRRFEFLHFML